MRAAPAHIDAKVRRLPRASVAELVSPWLMLHPSATRAAAPISRPPPKSLARLDAVGPCWAVALVVGLLALPRSDEAELLDAEAETDRHGPSR